MFSECLCVIILVARHARKAFFRVHFCFGVFHRVVVCCVGVNQGTEVKRARLFVLQYRISVYSILQQVDLHVHTMC